MRVSQKVPGDGGDPTPLPAGPATTRSGAPRVPSPAAARLCLSAALGAAMSEPAASMREAGPARPGPPSPPPPPLPPRRGLPPPGCEGWGGDGGAVGGCPGSAVSLTAAVSVEKWRLYGSAPGSDFWKRARKCKVKGKKKEKKKPLQKWKETGVGCKTSSPTSHPRRPGPSVEPCPLPQAGSGCSPFTSPCRPPAPSLRNNF